MQVLQQGGHLILIEPCALGQQTGILLLAALIVEVDHHTSTHLVLEIRIFLAQQVDIVVAPVIDGAEQPHELQIAVHGWLVHRDDTLPPAGCEQRVERSTQGWFGEHVGEWRLGEVVTRVTCIRFLKQLAVDPISRIICELCHLSVEELGDMRIESTIVGKENWCG